MKFKKCFALITLLIFCFTTVGAQEGLKPMIERDGQLQTILFSQCDSQYGAPVNPAGRMEINQGAWICFKGMTLTPDLVSIQVKASSKMTGHCDGELLEVRLDSHQRQVDWLCVHSQ